MRVDRATHAPARRILLALQSVSVGGMETQCAELAAEFRNLGLDVAVVVPEANAFDDLAQRVVNVGAQVVRLDTDARNGRAAEGLGILRLIRFVRAWRPDVVHVHTGGASGGVAIVAAMRLATSATMVLTEHNVPFAEPGLRLRVAALVKDRLLHALVALSARNGALRREWLGAPGGRFVGIRPGIRIPAATPSGGAARDSIRERLAIPRSATVIGSVVRLAEDKGLDDLLRAFALVVRDEACELLLVGDGPLRPALDALAKDLGIYGRIHHAGFQADAAPYLDAIDVFVLASPVGSGSIALLEAMARGLPAVITYCGPGEFLVPGVTGLCAPPRDPTGLASALLRLVRDPRLRATLGSGAAERARRGFRIEKMALDLLEVYATASRGTIPRRLLAARLDRLDVDIDEIEEQ